jgi:hypothetical protein
MPDRSETLPWRLGGCAKTTENKYIGPRWPLSSNPGKGKKSLFSLDQEATYRFLACSVSPFGRASENGDVNWFEK